MRTLRNYFQGFQVPVIILIIANVLFTFIPRLNELAYESSVLNSLLLFFAGAYFNSSFLRENKINWMRVATLTVIPSIILYFNTTLVLDCNATSEIFLYFIFVIPSFLYGIAIGRLNYGNNGFILKVLTPLIFLAASVIIIAIELYHNPQMYFYEFIVSYFPGTIYDELVEVDSKLILFRLVTVLIAGAIFLVSSLRIKLIWKYLIILGALTVFAFFKPMLGFSTSEQVLEHKLNKKIETSHFLIYADISVPDVSLGYYAGLHEFYFSELSDILKGKFNGKISSFIYANASRKRKLFGAGNADVAKPWLKQIYITANSVEKTLKHELSHVILGMFGSRPLLLPSNYNPMIIEGFATALTNNFMDFSVEYPVKLAIDNGFAGQLLKDKSGLDFFTVNPLLSYSYSGSFIKYLFQNRGYTQTLNTYKSGNLNSLEGFGDLRNEHINFLTNLPSIKNIDLADYLFGSPPIIKKKCIRSIAKYRQKGWDELEKKNYSEAVHNFNMALEQGLDYSSLYGAIAAFNAKKEYLKALNLLRTYSSDLEQSRLKYFYYLLTGKQFLYISEFDSSKQFMEKIINSKMHSALIHSAKIFHLFASDSFRFEKTDTVKISEYLSYKVNKEKNALFIPSYVEYAGDESNISDIISNFANNLLMYKETDIQLLMDIERIALQHKLYEDAEKIIDYAISKNTNYYRKEILSEEKQKVLWFKKNWK